MKIYWPLFKLLFVILYIWGVSQFLALGWCFFGYVVLCYMYQIVVAKVNGVIPIPAMDQVCFISSSKSILNVMNCMCYDAKVDPTITRHNMEKVVKHMPKLTYKIVEIAGDYYYKPMSVEETFEKAMMVNMDPKTCLKDKNDVDRYIQDNIGKKMPLDGP